MQGRYNRAFGARFRKLSKTIGHADLVAAGNGEAQQIAFGSLPPGSVYLGRAFNLNTFFTGGGATAVTMAVGTAADPDMVLDETNVFDTTTNDVWLSGTSGVLPPMAPLSGALVIEFDVDGTHTLAGLTAGEVTVELYFAIPDLDQSLG